MCGLENVIKPFVPSAPNLWNENINGIYIVWLLKKLNEKTYANEIPGI